MSPCPSLSVVALLLPLGSSAVSMSCVHWAAGASQVWELQRQARCFPCMKEVPRCFSPPGSSRAPAGGEHPGWLCPTVLSPFSNSWSFSPSAWYLFPHYVFAGALWLVENMAGFPPGAGWCFWRRTPIFDPSCPADLYVELV